MALDRRMDGRMARVIWRGKLEVAAVLAFSYKHTLLPVLNHHLRVLQVLLY